MPAGSASRSLRQPRSGELRARRKAAGWTQARLAAESEVGVSTIENLEAARSQATSSTCAKIAAALAVDPDAIFEPPDERITATEAASITGYPLAKILKLIDSGELASDVPALELSAASDLAEWMTLREVGELAGVTRYAVNGRALALERRGQARRAPDGTWRVARDAALELARKRGIFRHRIDPGAVDRLASQRRDELARRRVTLRCEGCRRSFETTPGRGRVDRHRTHYCSDDCYNRRRRHPVADELRANAGGCGSPTCTDPLCTIARGRCHRHGCSSDATIARSTSRLTRTVKGAPTLYCGRSCAIRARNEGAPWRGELAELKATGRVISTGSAAIYCGRAESILLRTARRLGLGRQIRRSGKVGDAWYFTREDVAALRRHFEPNDEKTRREPDIGEMGRLAPKLAQVNGKRVGRPPALSDDEIAEAHRLWGRFGTRYIADHLTALRKRRGDDRKVSRGAVRGALESAPAAVAG